MLFAEVGKVGSGGLEDPQAQQPEHGYQGEVAGMGGLPSRGEQGLELQVVNPGVGDYGRTAGRRTCSAGACSRRPPITQAR